MTIDQPEQEDAIALLATVRHLMTGAEIDMCERIGEELDYTREDVKMLDLLRLQFYAKICNWKDRRATA